MATSSNSQLSLGATLPNFTLPDVRDGASVASSSASDKGTLVAFVCNHCPYVVHIRKKLVEVANAAIDNGLSVYAINANDTTSHPQDGPDAMRALAKSDGFTFPFLFDESQDVARAFGAACTPELFLFDGARKLVYHGQFDDSRPGNGKPVTGADLSAAIDAVLRGEPPSGDQKVAIGCSIKWRR